MLVLTNHLKNPAALVREESEAWGPWELAGDPRSVTSLRWAFSNVFIGQ